MTDTESERIVQRYAQADAERQLSGARLVGVFCALVGWALLVVGVTAVGLALLRPDAMPWPWTVGACVIAASAIPLAAWACVRLLVEMERHARAQR